MSLIHSSSTSFPYFLPPLHPSRSRHFRNTTHRAILDWDAPGLFPLHLAAAILLLLYVSTLNFTVHFRQERAPEPWQSRLQEDSLDEDARRVAIAMWCGFSVISSLPFHRRFKFSDILSSLDLHLESHTCCDTPVHLRIWRDTTEVNCSRMQTG